MNERFEDELELFFGEATPAQARVYAQLSRAGWPEGVTLTGTIRGPHCEYAQTLPATFRFADRGAGETLLAEAVVPDPCFWTCPLPYLYDVVLELRRGNEVLPQVKRPFGIRPLAAKGRSLMFAGKRWVLRSGWGGQASAADIPQWRAHHAMLFAPQYDTELFAAASRHGVLVVADTLECSSSKDNPDRRLARHAAVGIVLRSDGPADALSKRRTGNLLYAQVISPGASAEVADWADVVVGEVTQPETFSRQFADCRVPVIARGGSGEPVPVATVRERCDELQRALAPYGDYAGYMM